MKLFKFNPFRKMLFLIKYQIVFLKLIIYVLSVKMGILKIKKVCAQGV